MSKGAAPELPTRGPLPGAPSQKQPTASIVPDPGPGCTLGSNERSSSTAQGSSVLRARYAVRAIDRAAAELQVRIAERAIEAMEVTP